MFLGEKMKRLFLFFLLLNVVLAFAQDDERTPEGYRIIRIEKEQTKTYQDSVAKVERIKTKSVNFRFTWGFMFSVGYKAILGSTDYDYWYMKDIDYTIEILEKILLEEEQKDKNEHIEYYYGSSW